MGSGLLRQVAQGTGRGRPIGVAASGGHFPQHRAGEGDAENDRKRQPAAAHGALASVRAGSEEGAAVSGFVPTPHICLAHLIPLFRTVRLRRLSLACG